MIDLIVNLDHVAVLRDKRRAQDPDPVAAAVAAEMAGASAVAVHLRGDRKWIQDRDVRLLREMVKTRLHLALAPTNEAVKFAYAVKPHVVNLVPERRDEVSSSIGLDVILNQSLLKKNIRALKEVGVKVAILVDPDADQVKAVQTAEADGVILNTRLYADSAREQEVRDELDRFETAARVAKKLRLRVVAGHGLGYHNMGPIAALPTVEAIEVGHALVSRALFTGLDSAIREMRRLMVDARGSGRRAGRAEASFLSGG